MQNAPALSTIDISKQLEDLDDWHVNDDCLCAQYKFKGARAAFAFITLVIIEAEVKNHHPECSFCYNTVNFKLTTHSAGSKISQLDLDLARHISKKAKQLI